ncbi:MAG TPA: GIY-YIG nuclease family protein [Rhizomicrobium sp.]
MPRPSSRKAPAFVYVLVSVSGAVTYVGWTDDLERRLARHNGGTGAKTTRGRQWRLVYAEKLASRVAAMRREYHLKRDRVLRAALRAN